MHVIDDDSDFRQGVRLLLASAGLAVEVYLSAEHFLSTYRAREIECALVDLRMPGLTGIELQAALATRHVSMPLIVISGFAETPSVVRAMQSGALDFLEKPIEADALLERIEAALEADVRRKQQYANRVRSLARLSNREHEVLDLLVDARTTIEVAHRLAISPKTVEKHRLKIFEKLNVDSVPALIRFVLG